MKRWLVLLISLLALAGVACASSGGHGEHEGGGSQEAGGQPTVLGAPADASESDRDVQVMALDELRFDPSSLDVSAGEVITFVVHNPGQNDHEFVLGSSAYQRSHEAEMQASDHMMMESAQGITIAPGQTKELTWEFSESGEVLYGCHEPGHNAGGMVGTIAVT